MFARLFLAVVVLAAVSGLAVFRVNSQLDIALGTLTGQVPEGSGVVTFVLSDARAAFDPFLLAREPDRPTAGDWIGANLIGGSPAVQTPTALVRAFADSTRLVSWTHQGFTAVSRDAMSRELEKALMKAHGAGARINIVAQGADAGPVLAALQRVGAGVAADKVVLLGVNKARLKLGKPGNVVQLANVWSTREIGSTIQVQLLGGKHDGETLDLEALWPNLSAGADSVDKSLRLLRAFIESPKTLDELLEEQQAVARDLRFKKEFAAEARAKAAEAEAARTAPRSVAAAAAVPARAVLASRDPGVAPAVVPGFVLPEGWSSAPVIDYDLPERNTGWYVSAPTEKIAELTDDRRRIAFNILKAPGVLDMCDQSMQLGAFPASKLGPGDHDAAIKALFEKSSGRAPQDFGSEVSRRTVHGRPASLFETMGAEGARTEFFVVETGLHVIYLVRGFYRNDKTYSAACANGYKNGFKAIADSLRPKSG